MEIYLLAPWASHSLGRPCSFSFQASHQTSQILSRRELESEQKIALLIYLFFTLIKNNIYFFCHCRYDPLSRTSLVGRPVIVSSDPDFNYNLLQQEGKLVERCYMDSFAKLLHQDATSVISKHGSIHKYPRNLVLAYFGPGPLKDKLLPKLETAISQALQDWSKRPTIEVKSASSSVNQF